MAQYRFRPLECLEGREVPAGDWTAGIANWQANESLLKDVAFYIVATGQENSFSDVFVDERIKDGLPAIRNDSRAAYNHVRDQRVAMEHQLASNPGLWETMETDLRYIGGLEFCLLQNAALAQRIGDMVGSDFTEPQPPVPPNPGPNDSGMTNTLPDVNSPNWVDQGNGLKIWDVRIGTGDVVAAGSNIEIFYTGWLLNGTQFDERRSPEDPIKFDLDGLIEAWKQGIPGMREGGIRRLYVPSELGYGVNGSPPSIPPNSDLVFEIKTISTSP